MTWCGRPRRAPHRSTSRSRERPFVVERPDRRRHQRPPLPRPRPARGDRTLRGGGRSQRRRRSGRARGPAPTRRRAARPGDAGDGRAPGAPRHPDLVADEQGGGAERVRGPPHGSRRARAGRGRVPRQGRAPGRAHPGAAPPARGPPAVGLATGGDRRGRASSEREGVRRSAQRPLSVRDVRAGLVEPLRPRGRPVGGRDARQVVQPSVHLRGHRAGQDAPPPCHRPLHASELSGLAGALRLDRDVHQRVHRCDPHRELDPAQAALPRVRRAARRRHPVPREQGADAGGVLPHLQLAARIGAPDRAHVRPPAEVDRDPRGPPTHPLRVGSDLGCATPRCRDATRDPPAQGRRRRLSCPPRGAGVHRRPHHRQHPRARGRPHPGGRLRDADA